MWLTRRAGLALLLAVACPQAEAADPGRGLAGAYVSLGVGANLLQPVSGSDTVQGQTTTWRFSTGAGGVFGVGWEVGNGLRVELDTNFAINKVDRAEGYGAVRAGGGETKYGGLVNLLYDVRLGLPVTPYLGLGLGGQVVRADNLNVSAVGVVVPGTAPTTARGDFAYQGIVGLAYPVVGLPGLSMTAEYRYLGLLDPALPYRLGAGGTSGVVKAGTDHNHSLMLGLRWELFAPPIEPAPAPLDSLPPVGALPEAPAARTYLVFFDWDRSDLTARARQIMAEAATASTGVQTTRIDVNGYTDLSGSAEYNRRLSLRRAETVQAELVRDGVPVEAIVIQGLGQTAPLVPTATGKREPQNRRVEIILH